MRADKEEIYRDIPGYEGKYQASFKGNIRRVYKKSGKTKIKAQFTKSSHKKVRFVKLTDPSGKSRDVQAAHAVYEAFRGKLPKGAIIYHKNGLQSDNCLANLERVSREYLGTIAEASANRKQVVKIDPDGNIVDAYRSARAAARANYMSYQTVIDRCNGTRKSLLAPDGFIYRWEEDLEEA